MAGKSNTSATFFAQKKLLGKAHTSNLKVDGEELIGSNIQASTNLIFGEVLPTEPAQTLYLTSSASGSNPTVEYIPFVLEALTGTVYDADSAGGGAGSDSGESSQSSGTHTYKFRLPTDYQASSSNSRRGNGTFDDHKIVHHTLGGIQLVPPFYSQAAPNPYIVKVYKDDGSGGVGDEIPLLDNIDWNVDYYNGILFLQDFDSGKIPAHARAFAYVGKMAEEVITSASAGGGSGVVSAVANGVDNRIATFTSSDALNGEANLTFDGSDFTLTGNASLNGSVIINEAGADKDFRVETNNKTNALFIDGGTDQVLILSGGSASSYDESSGTDVNFYVSGSVSSIGTSTKGTSVFGGDVVISGNLKTNKELVFNELLSGNANGSNTFFTLANTPFASNEISIFVNGQLQTPPALTTFQDYSVTGSNVFFTTGSTPEQGSLVMAIYHKAVT